jgi:uncharacterized protein
MQFLVIAFDLQDDETASRRMQAAEAHHVLRDEAIRQGERLLDIDILDAKNDIRGTAMIVDFPSLESMDAWIAREPYVTNKVWSKVEVYPCRIKAAGTPLVNYMVLH